MYKVFHACDRATVRRIPDEVVCKVVTDPDLTWPSLSAEGRSVTVYQRGAVRVIVGDDHESIVSVMWVHARTGGKDPVAAEADELIREVLS